MTFWHNPPKAGSQFAELNCSDYVDTHASFTFEEVSYQVSDDAYIFYGLCSKAYSVKRSKDNEFKLENELVTFKLHHKDYKRRKQVDGEWKDVSVELITKVGIKS